MPEGVRRGLDAGSLGVVLGDLLNAPERERTSKQGPEKVTVLRMSGEVGT